MSYPPPDYIAQQGALFAQQVKVEVDRLNAEYKKQLDAEVAKMITDLKHDAASRIRPILVSVIAVIVAGFALLAYAQTRSLNNTYIEFQNGVMALQKEVLATSNGMKKRLLWLMRRTKSLRRRRACWGTQATNTRVGCRGSRARRRNLTQKRTG